MTIDNAIQPIAMLRVISRWARKEKINVRKSISLHRSRTAGRPCIVATSHVISVTYASYS